MKDIIIFCDGCNKNISPHRSSYPREDILKLSCENTSLGAEVMFAIHLEPLLKQDLYFCGFGCIKQYLKVER